MTIQNVNLGSAPTGAGGDTFRSAAAKINENFSNNTHAASRQVGLGAGNVMAVGAFGLGATATSSPAENIHKTLPNGFYGVNGLAGFPYNYGEMIVLQQGGWTHRIFFPATYSAPFISTSINTDDFKAFNPLLVLNRNSTVDANGFVKSASPIVKLYANHIELNDEASEQNSIFKKIDVGCYLIKNTKGFAQEGWYIETPKDANGNILFSVIYETLENGDISVKTYKKKFDLETASIVADLDNPVDIPNGRWIDLRLQELPQEVIHDPEQ